MVGLPSHRAITVRSGIFPCDVIYLYASVLQLGDKHQFEFIYVALRRLRAPGDCGCCSVVLAFDSAQACVA